MKAIIKTLSIIAIILVPSILVTFNLDEALQSLCINIALAIFTLFLTGAFIFLTIKAIDKNEYFVAYIYGCIAFSQMIIFWNVLINNIYLKN